MPRNTLVTPEPVVLEGYQAVFKPSKYGFGLKAIVDQDMVDKLTADRVDSLKWAESKLKNPKRSTLGQNLGKKLKVRLVNILLSSVGKKLILHLR